MRRRVGGLEVREADCARTHARTLARVLHSAAGKHGKASLHELASTIQSMLKGGGRERQCFAG